MSDVPVERLDADEVKAAVERLRAYLANPTLETLRSIYCVADESKGEIELLLGRDRITTSNAYLDEHSECEPEQLRTFMDAEIGRTDAGHHERYVAGMSAMATAVDNSLGALHQ